jgi:putative ABC transport system permease protein
MRIYNFIRAFVKNALINRTYSILTLSALSLGIAISLLVLMYVYFEISFDRQWSGSERIYRAYSYGEFGDDKVNSAITPFVFNTILDGREGLESYTRILPGSRRLIIGDGIRSMESGFCYADSSFFKV